MKKQMIAAVLAVSFALPAFAQGTESLEAQVFDTQPEKVKVEELSQREMRETEGAWLGMQVTAAQAAILNAGVSSWSYAYSTNWGENGSVKGGGMAAGVGAMTGAAGEAATHVGLYRTAAANSIANIIFQQQNKLNEVLDSF